MNRYYIVILIIVIAAHFLVGCVARDAHSAKIHIDYRSLDDQGLRGSGDGKVAVSFEFAVPNTEACLARIRAIDPSIMFMPGSRGRIGATASECLCVGSTNQPRYREVLFGLADLEFVTRIEECHWE